MNLTAQDRLKLQDALVDAFPTEEDIGELAFRRLPAMQFASKKPGRIAREMIEWAERTHNLPMLLQGALAENDSNTLLAAVAGGLLKRVTATAPRYVATDPYMVCLPRPNVPFVNRVPLRAALTAMAAPNGTAVLAVQGEARSGKSHTSHLITYLSSAITQPNGQAVYRTVVIHLAQGDIDAASVTEDIALQLLGEIPQSIPKQNNSEQEARWTAQLANWIVGQIPAATARLGCTQIWIVVDGFQQVPVPPSTLDVLRRLARAALNQTALRVVLLDYSAALPDIERSVHRDHTRLASKADVAAHVHGIVHGTGRTMDSALMDKLVDAIWQESLPEDQGFMERLDQAICRRLPKLLGETE